MGALGEDGLGTSVIGKNHKPAAVLGSFCSSSSSSSFTTSVSNGLVERDFGDGKSNASGVMIQYLLSHGGVS